MILLTALAVVMACYLLIRSYARPDRTSEPLALYVADHDQVFVGIFVLDPNNAPADSLELLPGIGPVLADRIVEYRKQNRFDSPVDITSVKGIGPRLFERLRPYLKVKKW